MNNGCVPVAQHVRQKSYTMLMSGAFQGSLDHAAESWVKQLQKATVYSLLITRVPPYRNIHTEIPIASLKVLHIP